MVPSGSTVPNGWRSVVVAAEAGIDGEHQPVWEVQFDTSAVGQLVRGGPISADLRQSLVSDGWEEVLVDRPDGAPQTSSYWVQRIDGVDTVERSKRLHPSKLPPSADIGL